MNKNLLSVLLVICCFTLLSACSPNSEAQPDGYSSYYNQNELGAYDNYSGYNDGMTSYDSYNMYDEPVPVRPRNSYKGYRDGFIPENEQVNRTDSQEVADRLVELATRIDHVNDATAVVLGRYAVVGIDIDAKLDRSKAGTVKYSVAEALKADPRGAYAIVTADPDTNFRLREMGKEVREGHPVAGIMEELAEIVGRLMPQVPRSVQQPENPDGTPVSPE
ncbi:YhcN/YlaJ family sporulation lipoprotein [Bacillus horti]|uniref:YhcN/YlaJ family sporulation lipoprotein n=1 Tax=Caldalkalibacillus horti TaxID=77523 RepID=A0ABT9W109_9BACI|nr:YhcN/YlaJ family sporulation lipoprotein [Bacillus horti]MDQ0166923.1 YhcN/YlaJ family sporulation lipoprotein [Bacillus horti]